MIISFWQSSHCRPRTSLSVSVSAHGGKCGGQSAR